MIVIPSMRAVMRGAGGGGGPTDPYWTTVVNLTHFDGANGGTTFTNSAGTNAGGAIVQNGGSDALSTTQSVFGGASLRRSASGTAASAAVDAKYAFGTSDYTVEFRFRPDSVATANILDMREVSGGNTNKVTIYTLSNGTLVFFLNGADRITSSSGVITATTWKAIALSRVSGTTRMFVDGTQVGSNYTDSANYSGSARICCGSYTSSQVSAYYDEVRVSNGVFGSGAGRYAANYTIDTSAFPDS